MQLSPADHKIGAISTFLVLAISENVLPYAGKFLFAVVTAAVSAYISALIKNKMKPKA